MRCPTRKTPIRTRRTLTRSSPASSLKRLDILRYVFTCTQVCKQSLAQAQPDEASRRLPTKWGGGGIVIIGFLQEYHFFLFILDVFSL